MARRDYGWLDLLTDLPWWVSVIAAVVLYVFMAFVAPVVRVGNAWDVALRALPSAAWMAWFLLVPGAVSALTSLRKRRLLDTQRDLESIRSLTWRQFEELVAEAYRRRGFTVREHSAGGADGGTDVHVTKDGRLYLIQCKHWRTTKVGVNVVREMLGLVTAHGATGAVVMTTGAFTQEAEAFASGVSVELLSGAQVVEFVRAAQDHGSAKAPVARSSVPATVPQTAPAPTCPRCGSPLALRKAKRGNNAGTEFWGCSAYPKCRYTRNIES